MTQTHLSFVLHQKASCIHMRQKSLREICLRKATAGGSGLQQRSLSGCFLRLCSTVCPKFNVFSQTVSKYQKTDCDFRAVHLMAATGLHTLQQLSPHATAFLVINQSFLNIQVCLEYTDIHKANQRVTVQCHCEYIQPLTMFSLYLRKRQAYLMSLTVKQKFLIEFSYCSYCLKWQSIAIISTMPMFNKC